jgi:dynein heavy chain
MDRIYEGMTGDEELAEPLQFITPRTNVNLIEQLTILIDSILPEDPEAAPQEFNYLEKLFLFCLTWSTGGALVEKDREVFNAFLSTTAQTMLPHNLYENVYDIKTQKLDLWSSRVKEYVPPADGTWAAILVPTMDTTRYAWLLTQVQLMKRPVCFCGDSGAAKTVTVAYAFQGMTVSNPDEYIFLTVNFSSRTSSSDFQSIIMENIDRKSGKIYGPKTPGKKLIFFVDDMNMPTIDRYGTQQPNALLKFIVDRGQLYERKGELDLLTLVDLQFVGCTTPPAGGNNIVDPRLMSLFSVFNVTSPSKDSVSRIFNTILAKRFAEFPEEVTSQISNLTTATLQLFSSISEKLPRTPLKFHYIFNLRNISSVYEGLYGAVLDKTQTKGAVARLWRHECICIFADRLINGQDRALVCGQLIPDLVKRFFNDVSEEVMADPILYGDYAMSDPSFEDGEDPRLYEDLGSFAKVREKMEKMLEEYNFENPPMPLVLFDECLSHVTKVHRIIRFQKGCAMLVGYGGSGKQSVTKLATYVAGYKVWTINLVRNYKEADFRADL